MKIAAYCRVSTDKKEQLDSLQNQKDFFTEFAARNGHTFFRVYADEGISGTSLEKRTEFNRLLQDARLGLFDMVVVKDVSRFARNTVDALQSIRALKSMGINTLFLNANMDSMGDSEFILTLYMALAQEESNSLSKRVKFGKKINAEKGRVPPRIYGYDKLDNFTLAINEGEAEVVREIFGLYVTQGLGCRSISMQLNRDGHKTKLGSNFDARAVRRILVNPLYCGTLVNHKYEIADFLTKKQVLIPENEWFYHQRPEWAIVSPELFRRAQEIMAQRRNHYDAGSPFRQARHSSRHVFSTLIKCAHCGRSFTRKSYTYAKTRVYWRCVTNDQYTAERCENNVILDEGELLEQIRGYLASLIESRDAFDAQVIGSLEAPEEDPERRRRELEARHKKLAARRSRYQELYANDMISMGELKQKLSPIADELRELENEMLSMDGSAQSSPDAEEPARYCRQEIDRFLRLETVTNMDMRRLIDCITVSGNGNVRIGLRKIESL